jgi:hypothetical protein
LNISSEVTQIEEETFGAENNNKRLVNVKVEVKPQ